MPVNMHIKMLETANEQNYSKMLTDMLQFIMPVSLCNIDCLSKEGWCQFML